MPKSWNWGAQPRPLTGVKNFPPADTEYGKGFRDGCSNAMKSSNKGAPSFFGAQIDFAMLKKYQDYNQGMVDGADHCTNMVDWEVP